MHTKHKKEAVYILVGMLRRSTTLPDQTSLSARRTERASNGMVRTPPDTLADVVREGVLGAYAEAKLRTIACDVLDRLDDAALRTMRFADPARWTAVLNAAGILVPIFVFLWRYHEYAEIVESDGETAEFTRTFTTVRIEALCFVYRQSDLFRSMAPHAVLGDVAHVRAALSDTPLGLEPSPVRLAQRTAFEPAVVLSAYDLLRAAVATGYDVGLLLMQDARCVYVASSCTGEKWTLTVYEREVVRTLHDVSPVAAVRAVCLYLVSTLSPSQPLTVCAEPRSAAVLGSSMQQPAFETFWTARLSAHRVAHGVVECQRCGYGFKPLAAPCPVCRFGAADAAPPPPLDAAAHRLAGKVHLACGSVVPMFVLGTTPNLRCAHCGVTEPEVATCWQSDPDARQRCAMARFVPSDTRSKWYCSRCWQRGGHFVFVTALNQTCPRCSGFAL